ncbi:MAG: hypothetical protein ACRERV_09150, partial [Methylococcales bacterium]
MGVEANSVKCHVFLQANNFVETFHGTTIVSVRRNDKVIIGGDGQVSMGNTIMKGNARKVRRLYHDSV